MHIFINIKVHTTLVFVGLPTLFLALSCCFLSAFLRMGPKWNCLGICDCINMYVTKSCRNILQSLDWCYFIKTFTMYQLQHSFTVAVIEHGHCSYGQFHELYYILLQCLPYTNAMQCCSFLCLYYNTSSPIFTLKQYSMHFTTGSCQAVVNKGHAFASKITQKVHIFTHLN